jgi:hypothetical protein
MKNKDELWTLSGNDTYVYGGFTLQFQVVQARFEIHHVSAVEDGSKTLFYHNYRLPASGIHSVEVDPTLTHSTTLYMTQIVQVNILCSNTSDYGCWVNHHIDTVKDFYYAGYIDVGALTLSTNVGGTEYYEFNSDNISGDPDPVARGIVTNNSPFGYEKYGGIIPYEDIENISQDVQLGGLTITVYKQRVRLLSHLTPYEFTYSTNDPLLTILSGPSSTKQLNVGNLDRDYSDYTQDELCDICTVYMNQ